MIAKVILHRRARVLPLIWHWLTAGKVCTWQYTVSRLTLLLACTLLVCGSVYADESNSPSQTESGVQVRVKAWLGDNPDVTDKIWAPTEQVLLQVDVSTNRWFTSGTQIKGIDIPNVLVKQRNTFAVNYSEQESGQIWSHQRWEITLYPQASGDFIVPQGTVITQIADNNGHKKPVTLTTPTIAFHVALPSADLASSKDWFAASDVRVEQNWSINEDDELKVGGSVVRTIKIEANDSLSVLLPNVMPEQVSPQWKLYPNTPELVDTQNRSGYVSTRTDSQTYVLQNGGKVTWPEYRLWWWNTKTGQLEQIVLEGKTLVVKHTLGSWLRDYGWQLLGYFLGAMAALFVVRWLKGYYQAHPLPVWFVFYRALRRGEWQTCRLLLYQRLRRRRKLLAMAAASNTPEWQDAALNLQTDAAIPKDFVYLWKRIKQVRIGFALPKALVALEKESFSAEKFQ